MNQIIFDKRTNQKKRYIFKVQLIISIFTALILIIFIYINYNKTENMENISKIINKNMSLSSIYQANKTNMYKVYLGKIIIQKINLEYTVFKDYNENLLKIAPCKFYGNEIGEKGNICIAAHNYNDDRFFRKNR